MSKRDETAVAIAGAAAIGVGAFGFYKLGARDAAAEAARADQAERDRDFWYSLFVMEQTARRNEVEALEQRLTRARVSKLVMDIRRRADRAEIDRLTTRAEDAEGRAEDAEGAAGAAAVGGWVFAVARL